MANHVGAAGARFAATMTQSTNRLIVTLGARTGTVNTGVVTTTPMVWTPSTAATNAVGRRLPLPGGHRDRPGGRRLLAMARLRRISTGGILALAINALLALTALGIAFGAPGGGDEPRLKLAAAGGSLTLVNSKEGEAVFTAGAMRPGGQASGTVQITNSGSVPGALSVDRAADPLETPGDGGGLLSGRLELAVIDVTRASAPVRGVVGQAGGDAHARRRDDPAGRAARLPLRGHDGARRRRQRVPGRQPVGRLHVDGGRAPRRPPPRRPPRRSPRRRRSPPPPPRPPPRDTPRPGRRRGHDRERRPRGPARRSAVPAALRRALPEQAQVHGPHPPPARRGLQVARRSPSTARPRSSSRASRRARSRPGSTSAASRRAR